MAAGGGFGDAAGGRSSNQRSPMAGRSAPRLRPPHGRSLSSRGGFSAARAAMMRCAHGRLAQRLRAGRAVVAMGVGRKVCGERRMTAAAVLQRAAPVAAGCDRPHYANLAPEGLRMASSASRCSGEKVRQSICKFACLRARSERILCEMGPGGPPNPVLYVGPETPGRPGFS